MCVCVCVFASNANVSVMAADTDGTHYYLEIIEPNLCMQTMEQMNNHMKHQRHCYKTVLAVLVPIMTKENERYIFFSYILDID